MTLAQTFSIADMISGIEPCQDIYKVEAQRRLDGLTKPIGSLGRLEAIASQACSIFSGQVPQPLHKSVYVFAADHGVTEEGVSAYPREVTAQMVLNFLNGGAAISVLARLHQADLTVVDVGVDYEFEDVPGLCRMKVRRGSRNMHREAAMSHEELGHALETGARLAHQAKEKGEHIVAIGEMGIGNTTAASAITAALTGESIGTVTGRGAGLDDAGRNHKLHVVKRSIKRHFGVPASNPEPLEILRCVGGLEIAAMTGFILGAAAGRMAIVCDGFISTAAAAIAYAMVPPSGDYMFAGHCSEEPGHRHLLRYMGIKPILSLGMRLGEGTGAVLAMPVIESALHLYAEMATFASAGVSGASRREPER
ncbi:MAG: nicotinate-nucleotide--dimethylbenzimidazole phosphoribosyltransferase [Candidatus Sulfotelmatobacter sp.]